MKQLSVSSRGGGQFGAEGLDKPPLGKVKGEPRYPQAPPLTHTHGSTPPPPLHAYRGYRRDLLVSITKQSLARSFILDKRRKVTNTLAQHLSYRFLEGGAKQISV